MRLCSGKLDSGTEAHSTDPNGMPYVRQVLHGRLTAAVARSPHRCCCRYTPIPNPKPLIFTGTQWSCRPRASRRRRSWAPTGMQFTRWAPASSPEHRALYSMHACMQQQSLSGTSSLACLKRIAAAVLTSAGRRHSVHAAAAAAGVHLPRACGSPQRSRARRLLVSSGYIYSSNITKPADGPAGGVQVRAFGSVMSTQL